MAQILAIFWPSEKIVHFGAFPRHFAFTTIIDNFSTFFRRYFQPQKSKEKVENLRVRIFRQKTFFFGKHFLKTGRQLPKFSTFLKFSWGWKYPRKKVEKLSIIVAKSKCRRKVPKSSKHIFFGKKTFFLAKKNRKQVGKPLSFRLFLLIFEAGNIYGKK